MSAREQPVDAAIRRVPVATDRPYDVVVGRGALESVVDVVGGRRKVAIVTQPSVARYVERVREALAGAGVVVEVLEMGDGEDAKTLATVEGLGRELAARGVLRGDAIVALGGGVVGDTAGFLAAVYHRGIDVVQAPTTLLAQVDAAIGGKTAVNLPEGKNLLGAFHQPLAVLADPTTLATLAERELRCGLGEVAKYALMPEGGEVAALLDGSDAALLARDPDALGSVVAACATIKAHVVAADPHERTGIRATLNYGHTLAHALETTSAHALAHGEAVAIGLVFAATLAARLERIDAAELARVERVVSGLGLPTRVPADERLSAARLTDAMARDKKAKGGLTFVLPGPGGLELVDDPPARALESAFAAVGVAVG